MKNTAAGIHCMKYIGGISLLFLSLFSFGQKNNPFSTPQKDARHILLKSQMILSKKNLFTYDAEFKMKFFDNKDTTNFGENHCLIHDQSCFEVNTPELKSVEIICPK